MARIINDSPAYKLALEAADHQCQGTRTKGRGTDKAEERCIHTDRGGWPLILAVDDTKGPLLLCRPCLDKLQGPTHRRAERAVLPGQEPLF